MNAEIRKTDIEPSAQGRAGRWWALAALVVSGLVIGLDSTILITTLPSMFTPEERPRAVSLTAAGAFLGLPLGPLVAGWLLSNYAWGSVFLINAPIIVIALIGVWFLVPEGKDPQPRRFDWVGGVMAVVGVTALVYGVIEQPIHGWTDARVLGGIIGGALVLAAFVVWDLRHASPFVDPGHFRNRGLTCATMAFVVTGFGLFGVLFILSPYIQIVMGNDAQATGIRLLPIIGGVILGAVIGNVLTARLGARIGIPAGLAVTAAGLVGFSRIGADSGYGPVAAVLAVIGFGIGTALPTSLDVILGAPPPPPTRAGSAPPPALPQIAATVRGAILGSILNNAYQAQLGSHVAALPSQAREVALSSIAGAHAVAAHLPPPARGVVVRAANEAYTHGMAEVMLISAALVLAIAIAVAVFLLARITAMNTGDA